ncbi:MAG TPA: hypothetical protein VG223_06145 [Solirubrobacteraceae bacterium]|nr:hypothetical protein [Solirubrobacteraceae bacterium]
MSRTSLAEQVTVSFDVEEFSHVDGYVRVTGHWNGVRGRRFVRPSLSATVNGRPSRVLAELEHKPWSPEGEELWVAVFGWPEPVELAGGFELAVAPDIVVRLPDGTPVAPPASPPSDPARVARQRATDERDAHRQSAEQLRRASAERDRATGELAQARQRLSQASAAIDRAVAERDRAAAELARAAAERDQALAAQERAGAELAAVRAELSEMKGQLLRASDDHRGEFDKVRWVTADGGPPPPRPWQPRRLSMPRGAPATWSARVLALLALTAFVVLLVVIVSSP